MLEEDKSREVESDQTETGKGEEGQVEVSRLRGKGGEKKRGKFLFQRTSTKNNIQRFLKKNNNKNRPVFPLARLA